MQKFREILFEFDEKVFIDQILNNVILQKQIVSLLAWCGVIFILVPIFMWWVVHAGHVILFFIWPWYRNRQLTGKAVEKVFRKIGNQDAWDDHIKNIFETEYSEILKNQYDIFNWFTPSICCSKNITIKPKKL